MGFTQRLQRDGTTQPCLRFSMRGFGLLQPGLEIYLPTVGALKLTGIICPTCGCISICYQPCLASLARRLHEFITLFQCGFRGGDTGLRRMQ